MQSYFELYQYYDPLALHSLEVQGSSVVDMATATAMKVFHYSHGLLRGSYVTYVIILTNPRSQSRSITGQLLYDGYMLDLCLFSTKLGAALLTLPALLSSLVKALGD
jgi:hypothetical protein